MEFKNKKVAVLGLGVEGISTALFLVEKGAVVTVLDRRTASQIKEEAGEIEGIRIIGGENYLGGITQYEVVVRSPGIQRNLPEIVDAEKKGTIITSQTKIFFDLCPCPIIGVTGTKGKGTTASLIWEMFKAQNLDVHLGGNIGVPPLDFLDKLKKDSWVVLELSSFQLQDLTKSSHIAVMLMVVPEHLNYHKDMNEYVNAKRNILRFQTAFDLAILNRDYPAANESDIHTEGKIFYVSRERGVEEGCSVRDGKIIISRGKAEDGYDPYKGSVSSPRQISETEMIDIKDILLPGKHNLENVCAAGMAATLAGVSNENIVKVLKTFKGLEHRLELVGEVNGVKYYDDSFSTTPETAIAAIVAFKQPEILILGGSSKGSDFTQLGEIISKSENIKAIIGIGSEWVRIKPYMQNTKYKIVIIEGLKDMHEVVQKASEIAKMGDVVLLSPACASFGMFKNYKDRGKQFKREVKKLSF